MAVRLRATPGNLEVSAMRTMVAIGGPYTANAAGEARTMGAAADLAEVHFVFVRWASNFQLPACAPVGMGG
ncbi:MAG TPA: hypothetical protein VFU81_22830 [Thermomicrobiales bacterium]|nr:hypothetical protein [Thermomicrobiales bacterium]